MGLIMNGPKSGTVRLMIAIQLEDFLRTTEVAAEITRIVVNLIYRLNVILDSIIKWTITSTIYFFSAYAEETADIYALSVASCVTRLRNNINAWVSVGDYWETLLLICQLLEEVDQASDE